jgi:nucleoid-associated protein YgaU
VAEPRNVVLDTNRCSWSYGPYDEHTFEGHADGGHPVMATATATPRPVRTGPGRRPRVHTTYRRPMAGSAGFRPGGAVAQPAPVGVAHRPRSTHGGCDDPRAVARAAALRRRHIFLGVVAVGLLLALAVPWSSRGSAGLASPDPTPAGSTLSAHSAYVVHPGDTLWSIAERLDPQGDPRPVMNALARQVGGDTVRPGEKLLLP